MRRVERSARIGASPSVLFDYLANLDNVVEWQSGVVSAEHASGGQLGIGSTARIVREMMGRRLEAPVTVTGFDPPRRLELGSEISGVRATLELSLAEAGTDATELGIAMEIRGTILTAFMEPMIAGAAGGDIDESLRRLSERFPPSA